MNKVSDLLNKYFIYALWAFLFVSLIVNFRSCGINKESRKIRQAVEVVAAEVDTLNAQVYSKKELDIRIAIEGYEISKRMLYDNNTVIRTTRRPDDILIQYDKKIKELREQLNEIK